MRKSRFLTQTSLRRRNSESLRKCEFLRVCNSRGKLIEECVPIMQSKCWERHARFLRRATPFGQPNRHALHSHREMFQTYRYGKTQLASDRKSLLGPESGIHVRVVGMLQIEQSELWWVHWGYPYSHTLWRGGWCLVPTMWLCSPLWRWQGCWALSACRLKLKNKKSKLFSKIQVQLTHW